MYNWSYDCSINSLIILVEHINFFTKLVDLIIRFLIINLI
jgi:hypothetical protein